MSILTDVPAPQAPEDAKTAVKQLQKDLAVLQQRVKEAGLPVVVLLEGWSGAGKGRATARLISELDPRGYQVYSYTAPEPSEARRPPLWRYWRDLPPKGQFAILDRSWYRQSYQLSTDAINTLERQLCDDGYLVLKFFLHISEKEQRKRLDKLMDCPDTLWRIGEADVEQNRHYRRVLKGYETLLEATDTPHAPWHVILNESKNGGAWQLLSTVKEAVEDALAHGAPKPRSTRAPRWSWWTCQSCPTWTSPPP